ncbi:MAG: DUF669 domain-containing protein [Patescibacteria group bacterium]|nr:DUF669 domain-containing protein [Patescibacteria group bacterium]
MGVKLFENFNVEHPNKQTVEIAFKWLKTLCLACGLPDEGVVNESLIQALIGKHCLVTVVTEENDYGKMNRVRYYEKLGVLANTPPYGPSF